MSHDVAFTLQSLGMLYASKEVDPMIVVDWHMVETHVKNAEKSKSRIKIDPECLRWTPLISPMGKQVKEVRVS